VSHGKKIGVAAVFLIFPSAKQEQKKVKWSQSLQGECTPFQAGRRPGVTTHLSHPQGEKPQAEKTLAVVREEPLFPTN
jgi:hypothetical protein